MSRGVLNTNLQANDWAPVIQGQAKWMAEKAKEEFDENLVGGSGTNVAALIATFTLTNNYFPLNLGQLKYVATPFYLRLIAQGYTNAYPWTTDTTADDVDYAPANIGQLKYVFSFDLSDSDEDGLPDWWERKYFYDLDENGAGDPDGDGFINLQEYLDSNDPTASDHTPSSLPWSIGFETNEGYQVGDMDEQAGWLASGDSAVQDDLFRSGDQAGRVRGITAAAHHYFANSPTVVTQTVHVFLSDASVFPPQTNDMPMMASTLVSYDPDSGIMAFDGDGNGGGTWTLAADTLLPQQWVEVKIVQRYADSPPTWDLYINGNLKLSGLGFMNDEFDRLHALHVEGGCLGEVYVDDVSVSGP